MYDIEKFALLLRLYSFSIAQDFCGGDFAL